MTQKLVKSKFRNWCETKGKNTCGKALDAENCPIANYLKETTGNKIIKVGRVHYFFGDDKAGKLPIWAKGFVQRVDITGGKISGNKALELL